jgi:hypothetical protein
MHLSLSKMRVKTFQLTKHQWKQIKDLILKANDDNLTKLLHQLKDIEVFEPIETIVHNEKMFLKRFGGVRKFRIHPRFCGHRILIMS